ncbi:MAG: terminase large subunit [Candidatus Omnitrophica bacterium]|nr:terminase large subunit [Candidatus Omnitrophota bacterium]
MPLDLLGNHPAEQYARDVLTGKIVTCRYVKLAAARHVRDLAEGYKRGLWFDAPAAQHRLDFYQFCRHFEGEWAGQVIEPSSWQQFIKWCIYGWKRADGSRRFRKAYISVARKAGKSTDVATDGIYLAFFDGESGAQVFTAATKFSQARIIHRASTSMVKASPALRRRINVFKNNLHVEETASIYEPLGQDSNTEDGLNVHGALIDEYHAHPDAEMYNVLRSGMGSRRQPLLYVITTAGFDKQCACYTEEEYAKNVLEGVFDDDSYFAIIFTLDENDKWTDETVWLKSNPNLGITPKLEDMQEQCQEAMRVPSKQNEFLTKRLNIWTEAVTAWITVGQWDRCAELVDAEGLRGRKCFGAFDLSSTTDITAWALCFPPENEIEPYRFIWRFFVPQDGLEKQYPNKEILGKIKTWIRQGFITPTPGDSVDYDFVKAKILEDATIYDIREIPYDPYNASQMVNDLSKEDLELVEFRQGFLTMSPAAKDFESKVLKGQIAHGGNPVMRWMISCAEIAKDPAGNIKPVKPDRQKSVKRIDGVVAAIMALDRAVKLDISDSVYKTRGLLVL